jgi:zinc transport system ATP-binding protein
MTSPTIIQVDQLNFAYEAQTILEDVNLSVQAGEFLAIIGPNGGGKTTLLRLLLGLLQPNSGRIEILGAPPKKARQRIGYVAQDIHINREFPITALDVVLMGKLAPGWGRHIIRRKDRISAHEALEQMGMGAYCRHRIGELSGGQRQRVLIARALVTQPKLLFLDEPTASIDAEGQSNFYCLLRELNREVTIVMVSHDLMVLSSYVKSVACVNRYLHYHDHAEIDDEMVAMMYPHADARTCPVELITHGHLPHRVLKEHGNGKP